MLKVALSVSVGAAIVMVILASMAWTPTHRSSVEIPDPPEADVPPDYDALRLLGRLDGDVYEISLVVEGTVQDDRYIVNVVGRNPGLSERPNIYKLEYIAGVEESYGIPVGREGNTLTLMFPMELLLKGAYVVGLEAVVFGPDGAMDFVKATDRENLVVQMVLPLPFNRFLLLAGAVSLGVASAGIFRALRLQSQP